MCWRTRSFSGWASDQFHPASSGCEKNCQHQCFVLGGLCRKQSCFFGLLGLVILIINSNASIDSPSQLNHPEKIAEHVIFLFIYFLWLKLLLLTHSYLPPKFGTCNLQWPILVFHKNGGPEGWICLFTCVKEIVPLNHLNEATQKKHKNCSPNEEIPSAHVCMWSTCLYVKLYGLLWLQWLWCWWGSTTYVDSCHNLHCCSTSACQTIPWKIPQTTTDLKIVSTT